jgi:hypothetical protein
MRIRLPTSGMASGSWRSSHHRGSATRQVPSVFRLHFACRPSCCRWPSLTPLALALASPELTRSTIMARSPALLKNCRRVVLFSRCDLSFARLVRAVIVPIDRQRDSIGWQPVDLCKPVQEKQQSIDLVVVASVRKRKKLGFEIRQPWSLLWK